MKRIVSFLKSTKWISRILFALWIFFSIFANFPNESRLQIVLEFGAFLLIPACIIEMLKNPIIKEVRRKTEHTAVEHIIESKEDANPKVSTGIAKIVKSTKIISRILFFVWVGYLLLFLLIALSGAFSFIDFVCISIVVSALFLIPAAVIEYKKNPIIIERNPNRQKPCLSHSIWGVILLEFSPFMVMGGILGVSYSEPNERIASLIPAGFGVGLFVLGILLISGYITKRKIDKEQEHHYIIEKEKPRTEVKAHLKTTADVVYSEPKKVKVQSKTETNQQVKNRAYNKNNPNPLMPLLAVVIILVVLVAVISSNAGKSTSNVSLSPTEASQPEETLPIVDLSAFDGDCGVTATVDIEKESGSHLLDVNILATNNTQKDISKLTLYFVKCYNTEGPLKNWEYSDRLKFEDISAGETKHGRWVLGTTNVGALEYRVYVAYVLYSDGTEWGKETVEHNAVVTRAEEVDVCYYKDGVVQGANSVEKQYVVTYSARIIQNNSVGDSWSFGMKCGETSFLSGKQITVTVAADRGPKLTIWAQESDASKNDFGQKDIVFSDIAIGETETITEQVMVTENDGRYIGRDAYIQFTVTIKRIS